MLNPADEAGYRLIYQPNAPLRLGIMAGYDNFRIGFTVKLPAYLNPNDQSEGYSFQVKTQTPINNLGIEILVRKDLGFYLENYQNFYPNWSDYKRKPYSSSIITKQISFTTHMVFSNRFSLKAVLNQSERQLKSAGGFGLQLGLNFFSLRCDSQMIPLNQDVFYGDLSKIYKVNNNGVLLRPGYAYTYIHKSFFSSTVIFAGLSFDIQNQNYFDGKNRTRMVSTPQLSFIQSIGFNNDVGFMSLSYNYQGNFIAVSGSYIQNQISNLSLSAGIRF